MIQALTCIISIKILKLPFTLDYFDFPAIREEQLPAPVDLECQRVVNEVLLNALNHGSSIAAPATLVWGMILVKMRDVTQTALGEGGSDDESFMDETPTKPRRRSPPALPTAFADAMENVMDLSVEDPIKYFGEMAVEAGAVSVVGQLAQMLRSTTAIAWASQPELHARVTVLEWMREGLLFTEYSSQVVDTTLAILHVDEDDRASGSQPVNSIRSTLIQIFVRDGTVFIPRLLHVAQSRYPYEITPFLNLCKALCPSRQAGKTNLEALPLSEATSRFTQLMPRDFRAYELIREDEETNCIRSTADIPLFSDRAAARGTNSALAETRQLIRGGADSESFIPRGTVGWIMDKNTARPPLTVMWEHQHSVLRYLGFLLSNVPASSTRRDLLNLEGDLDKETQADIIDLLAALLDATTDSSAEDDNDDQGNARWVLEQASDALDRNQDIIAVVSDIFEDALGSQYQGREEGSSDLLCACIHFIHAITKVVPGRVWPLLARSEFLDVNGRGGKMTVILQSTELAAGRSQLLLQCVKLYETLLTDVMQHATTRKAPSVTTAKRFSQASEVATGSSRKVVSKILSTLTQSFVSVVLNLTNDNQAIAYSQADIHTRIIKSFDMIVSSVYAYDDQNGLQDKLTTALAPPASLLAEVFLAPTNNFAVTALLSLMMAMYVRSTSSDLLSTTLQFFSTLLEAGLTLDSAPSFLEQQLFQSLPFLARVFVSEEAAKQHIVDLLSLLVTRADISDTEPKSLLGHLGPQTAEDLLAELANLDRPLNTSKLEAGIWNLFARVMSCRQQWFATYILTGDSPKKSLSKKDTTEMSRKAILEIALDEVAKLPSLSTSKALSVLTFINAAQSYWPWITSKLRNHEDFMNRIVDYLGSLTNGAGRDTAEQSYQLASAAQVVDILALYLHNMRQMGDISFIKKLGPKLGYLRAHGVAVPRYNTSLHSNLKRNFEKKYPGCTLVNIKSVAPKSAFGNNYFYDIDFADQLLGRDSSWSGSKNSFRDEVQRANENLSQVEAHILLMSSWRSLTIELSQSVGQEKTLQKYLATTVHQCLVANTESNLSEAVFQHLIDSRIQLALALMQRLVVVRSDVPTMRTLLTTTWDTLRHSVPDPENAFAGTNTALYRSLLRLLLLVLQPHTYMEISGPVTSTGESGTPTQPSTEWSTDILPLLVEIVTEVVGKGFRSLTTLLHEDATSVRPSDFALLTALLQTILRIPDVASVHTHLTLRLCDTAVHRYAIALFSWSDKLTVLSSVSHDSTTSSRPSTDGNVDPIYADVTLSFLHTLTTIPQMAEYLATEGILSQLSTAPILAALRNPPTRQSRSSARSVTQPPIGYGPLDQPTRFHHFWSRSLLPLTLNILHAVGASFAAEAAAFINTFPAQLERASGCLSAPNGGDITMNEASELATLSLLSLSLEKYAQDPVAIVGGQTLELTGFDKAGLKEDVEGVLRGGGLDGRVVAITEREAGMAREKSKNGKEGQNRLVEMVRGELEVVLRCLGGTV